MLDSNNGVRKKKIFTDVLNVVVKFVFMMLNVLIVLAGGASARIREVSFGDGVKLLQRAQQAFDLA